VSLVEVQDLRVELVGSGLEVVDEVSFRIDPGEVLGVVGESGSGKTTIGVALLGHARKGAKVARGTVRVDGTSIFDLSQEELRAARGKLVAYIPQDPAFALNPALRIGKQLREQIEIHEPGVAAAETQERVRRMLREVSLPDDDEFLERFPHQLSGGQAQRVCIAMAFLLRPKLVILDEPTTGLDVTTQAHVLETVKELCEASRAAILYVSHDLAVVANIADRVMVMYAGRVVEEGRTERIFGAPGHPYTVGLIAANPEIDSAKKLQHVPGKVPELHARPSGCFFHPRCSWADDNCTSTHVDLAVGEDGHAVRCLKVAEIVRERPQPKTISGLAAMAPREEVITVSGLSAAHGRKQVLHDVSLGIRAGECLALVGESGSGKTTLARSIIGLHAPSSGEIRLEGALLERRVRNRPREARRAIQYVFQSPFNSLNPRRTVRDTLSVPIRQFFDVNEKEVHRRLAEALERVALPQGAAAKYPSDLSGGERQRVSIARALVSSPSIIVCDEVTSALDVSVQAVIVNLLRDLQQEENLALLFVTHNIGLLSSIAHRVLVMKQGRIVEEGEVGAVLRNPEDPYTRSLIADTPSIPTVASGVLDGRRGHNVELDVPSLDSVACRGAS
jgi:peptide/nickel transport system ATP-binding protein